MSGAQPVKPTTQKTPCLPRETQGIALAVTLLVVLVVGALTTGAALVGANHLLVNRHYDRMSSLEAVAESGLEYARARINADKSLYPANGYNTLEDNQAAFNANGTIPGVQRSIYVGPSGATSGQYGVFGSIVTVVSDNGGGKVVRRSEVSQESFAKFAYFTDIEPGHISFGGGDAIFGPVHSNDDLKIYPSGASFFSSVRTAKTVVGAAYGTFNEGYTESAPRIEMPSTADLNGLRAQAIAGNTRVVGDQGGGSGRASTRLEFIAVDINGDGDSTDNGEGFMRVYQSTDSDYVSGLENIVFGDMSASENCGWWSAGAFTSSQAASDAGWTLDAQRTKLKNDAGRRCYLGGSDSLYAGFQATNADDPTGGWMPFPGTVSATIIAARAAEGDADYLWPINRTFNPNFKGVIFVDGKVGISGKVRGRITIAATDDIIILDDLTYATDPGLGSCEDIVGIFSGDDVRVAENPLNNPWSPTVAGVDYRTFDDTKDEFIHGVILALDIFTVENHSGGSGSHEPCEGDLTGRGCLYLTGGIIQKTRGAVGTIWLGGGGAGYVKRYSYDPCAAQQPPPYFPTTGHFSKGQYYEIDPAGFNVTNYFGQITQGGP